jgi:hypothetical protein
MEEMEQRKMPGQAVELTGCASCERQRNKGNYLGIISASCTLAGPALYC